MSTDLVRTKLETSLRVKSLTDLVRVRVGDLIYLLIDVSGSMDWVMRNGKTKHAALCEVIDDINKQRPNLKMIAFGGHDGGAYEVTVIPHPAGGTPLHSAIQLAKVKQAGRCIVISDGMPDHGPAAMDAAREFGGQIDVVFVGDPDDRGEEFLKALAAASGGTQFTGDLSQPKELGKGIMGLIGSGDEDEDDEE